MPKLYTYFNTSEGLEVLVMELLGDSLSSYVQQFADKINPNFVKNIAVKMVGFELNIEHFHIFLFKINI